MTLFSMSKKNSDALQCSNICLLPCLKENSLNSLYYNHGPSISSTVLELAGQASIYVSFVNHLQLYVAARRSQCLLPGSDLSRNVLQLIRRCMPNTPPALRLFLPADLCMWHILRAHLLEHRHPIDYPNTS